MLKVMSLLLFLQLFIFFLNTQAKAPFEYVFERSAEYALPELSYNLSSLEPYIGLSTMKAHYLGHHQGYTTKMNNFLRQWRQAKSDELSAKSPFEILNYLNDVPDEYKTSIRNNAGGYVNHAFYWSIMSPNEARILRAPSSELEEVINANFGSFQAFKDLFTAESLKLFGSGYVWLVMNGSSAEQQLSIMPSYNQDCPVSQNFLPILVIDIWEHAYYLQHQFRRADHVNDFWSLVDWQKVEALRNFWIQYLATHEINPRQEL